MLYLAIGMAVLFSGKIVHQVDKAYIAMKNSNMGKDLFGDDVVVAQNPTTINTVS